MPAARHLLDDAGWKVGPDGVRRRNGQALSVTLTSIAGADTLLKAATLLQAQWRALGADVAIRTVAQNALVAPDGILAKGNFDFALVGIGFSTTPDRSSIFSSRDLPPAGFNYAGYRNAAVDRAIDVASSSLDPSLRKKAFATIQKAVAEEVPYVPLVWVFGITGLSTSLEGYKGLSADGAFWNVYEWRLR